jgi:hypothetical protein
VRQGADVEISFRHVISHFNLPTNHRVSTRRSCTSGRRRDFPTVDHPPSSRAVTVNLAIMGSVQDGTVYLSLDGDLFDEENTAAHWTGHCEFGDGSQFEFGPDFLDANDAVTWWRKRGAKRIYIRLDFEEYLWAGEGSPSDDQAMLSVFDPADPRGRPDGAANTLDVQRRAFAEGESVERVVAALDEGRRLTRRREAILLSIDELADRVGQSTEWLLDVESGKSTYDVTFFQWVDLVWATRQRWPEEMRTRDTGSVRWVAQRGQFLREAEVFVNKMLGLYD